VSSRAFLGMHKYCTVSFCSFAHFKGREEEKRIQDGPGIEAQPLGVGVRSEWNPEFRACDIQSKLNSIFRVPRTQCRAQEERSGNPSSNKKGIYCYVHASWLKYICQRTNPEMRLSPRTSQIAPSHFKQYFYLGRSKMCLESTTVQRA